MSYSRSDRYGSADDEFPVRLALWLAANHDLVDALIALRRLGTEGTDALDAALDVKRVAIMRLSFGLWSTFVVDDGQDPERVLAARLPQPVVNRLCHAIGGLRAVDERCLHLVAEHGCT